MVELFMHVNFGGAGRIQNQIFPRLANVRHMPLAMSAFLTHAGISVGNF